MSTGNIIPRGFICRARVRKALGDLVFHIGNVRGSNIEEEKHGKGRNDGDAGRGGERGKARVHREGDEGGR